MLNGWSCCSSQLHIPKHLNRSQQVPKWVQQPLGLVPCHLSPRLLLSSYIPFLVPLCSPTSSVLMPKWECLRLALITLPTRTIIYKAFTLPTNILALLSSPKPLSSAIICKVPTSSSCSYKSRVSAHFLIFLLPFTHLRTKWLLNLPAHPYPHSACLYQWILQSPPHVSPLHQVRSDRMLLPQQGLCTIHPPLFSLTE